MRNPIFAYTNSKDVDQLYWCPGLSALYFLLLLFSAYAKTKAQISTSVQSLYFLKMKSKPVATFCSCTAQRRVFSLCSSSNPAVPFPRIGTSCLIFMVSPYCKKTHQKMHKEVYKKELTTTDVTNLQHTRGYQKVRAVML